MELSDGTVLNLSNVLCVETVSFPVPTTPVPIKLTDGNTRLVTLGDAERIREALCRATSPCQECESLISIGDVTFNFYQ